MTVPAELAAAIDEFVSAPTVLVASDFDGVLAPLVMDPTASRPLPGTIESLRGLAALSATYAAVVSGRLVARLGLTDAKGHPVCAHVRPPLIDWSAAPAE